MTMLTTALLQLVERRKADRRKPFATIPRAEAERYLLAIRYTGSVTVEYANGVPMEYGIMGARIVLDKTPISVDSEKADA